MHFTYVIGSGSYCVKIGHSRAPQDRVRELQTGSAANLWVAHTWRMARDEAVAMERALHKAFAWRAMEGEWFSLTAGPVIAVGDLLLAGRPDDAERLLAIVKRREAIVEEATAARAAWRWVPGRDRRRVELEAAATRKALAAEDAALQLESYDLGYLPDHVSERHLPGHLEHLRTVAAAA
jgi:hypothetical protein